MCVCRINNLPVFNAATEFESHPHRQKIKDLAGFATLLISSHFLAEQTWCKGTGEVGLIMLFCVGPCHVFCRVASINFLGLTLGGIPVP